MTKAQSFEGKHHYPFICLSVYLSTALPSLIWQSLCKNYHCQHTRNYKALPRFPQARSVISVSCASTMWLCLPSTYKMLLQTFVYFSLINIACCIESKNILYHWCFISHLINLVPRTIKFDALTCINHTNIANFTQLLQSNKNID